MSARTVMRAGRASRPAGLRTTPEADARPAGALDWLAADALLVVFALLVTLLLDVVPGWVAPLRAWLAISTWLFAALSLHAGVQGAKSLRRHHWRAGGVACACAAGLALAAAAAIVLAMRLPADDLRATLDDATPGASAPR